MFTAKTDWNQNDIVMPEDLNRIEEGVKNGSGWIGTHAEYEAARADGTIDDDTICYITDDDGMDDRIISAIEEAVKKYMQPDQPGADYPQLVNYTMLYDQGDECESVTGGVRASSGNTSGTIVIKNNNDIVLDAVGVDKSVAVLAAKSIDVSNFVKMHGIGTGIYALNADNDTYSFGLLNTAHPNKLNSSHDERIRWVASSSIRNVKEITEVDISTVNQSCYPAFFTTNYRKATMHHMFLTKPDNWQLLCTKAGVVPPATLDALLSNATAMTKIMTNDDAINYMVKQCTGDFMVACCNSSTVMSALVNNIAYDKAFENNHWRKFMLMCPVSLAAMKGVAVKVPTMTSDTVPSGQCVAITILKDQYKAYKAFDGLAATQTIMRDAIYTAGDYIGYAFGREITLFGIELKQLIYADSNSTRIASYIKSFGIYAGTSHDDAIEIFSINRDNIVANETSGNDGFENILFKILNRGVTASYFELRIKTFTTRVAVVSPAIYSLQFYGKAAN